MTLEIVMMKLWLWEFWTKRQPEVYNQELVKTWYYQEHPWSSRICKVRQLCLQLSIFTLVKVLSCFGSFFLKHVKNILYLTPLFWTLPSLSITTRSYSCATYKKHHTNLKLLIREGLPEQELSKSWHCQDWLDPPLRQSWHSGGYDDKSA